MIDDRWNHQLYNSMYKCIYLHKNNGLIFFVEYGKKSIAFFFVMYKGKIDFFLDDFCYCMGVQSIYTF